MPRELAALAAVEMGLLAGELLEAMELLIPAAELVELGKLAMVEMGVQAS
jgi:hypothetical protein